MQNELTQRWVEELRSGRWYKGRGQLKDKDLYSCLGVLCDISGVDTWRRVPESKTPEQYLEEYRFLSDMSDEERWRYYREHIENTEKYLGEDQFLPSEVRELANIREKSGQFQVTDEWLKSFPESMLYSLVRYLRRGSSLASLNDAGASFSFIAEVIMNEPPGLFGGPEN